MVLVSWEAVGRTWPVIGSWVHDLSRSAVACHARLGRPSIGSHLQTDDVLPFFHLVIREISPVLLSFPASTEQIFNTSTVMKY